MNSAGLANGGGARQRKFLHLLNYPITLPDNIMKHPLALTLSGLLLCATGTTTQLHAETPPATVKPATGGAAVTARQIINNGSFEELTAHWELEQHAPALGDLTISDEGPAGAKCAKIELLEAGDAHWKMSLIQKGLTVRSDKRYRVSFQAKADTHRWIAVALGQHLEPYKVLAVNPSVEIGTTWSRVSVLLRPSADEANARFSISNLGQNLGTIWVTDIKVVEE